MIFSLLRLLLLVCVAFGCTRSHQKSLRIGMDPTWSFAGFGSQNVYINGYIEDLLLEMARYSGAHFELIKTNQTALLEGLKKGTYDAIFTTLPSYEYHLSRYDFSKDLFETGPVLIVPFGSKKTDLSKINQEVIGILMDDPIEALLGTYPHIIIRSFDSIPHLLNAVVNQEIEGAVLNQIPAVNYVGDLYAGILEMTEEVIVPQGIHLISLKGKDKLEAFDQTFMALEKKKKVDALLKKWELSL